MVNKNESENLNLPLFENRDFSSIFNDLIFLLCDVNRSQRKIEKQLEINTKRLKSLENAVAYVAYIRSYYLKLKFDRITHDLWVTDKLFIHFRENESELLSLMFMKNGKQRKRKFYTGETALQFKKNGLNSMVTANAVYQTAKRIQNKLQLRFGLGGIIIVNKQEFYFIFKS